MFKKRNKRDVILNELKQRVFELDEKRKSGEDVNYENIAIDYISALENITVLDRKEIEGIADDIIKNHKSRGNTRKKIYDSKETVKIITFKSDPEVIGNRGVCYFYFL